MSGSKLERLKRDIRSLKQEDFEEFNKWFCPYSRKRFDKAHQRKRELELESLKHLPIGSKVLLKRGRKVGEVGVILKHGRKYVWVDFNDEYSYWKFPYHYIGIPEDKLAQEQAKTQKNLQKIFGGV